LYFKKLIVTFAFSGIREFRPFFLISVNFHEVPFKLVLTVALFTAAFKKPQHKRSIVKIPTKKNLFFILKTSFHYFFLFSFAN